MATVWEAAEMMLRTAGDEDAALATARDLVSICQQGEEIAEAAYWLAVADAIAWLSNPQPLIAPDSRIVRVGRSKMARRTHGLELPRHRSNVLRFRKQLREIWKRSQSDKTQTDKPEDESS